MRVCTLALSTAFAALAGTLAGCSGGGETKVHGKVTLDGGPLPAATLAFHQGGQPTAAFGALTKEDGTYEIVIPGETRLDEGEYSVTAVKYTPKKGAKVEEGMEQGQLIEAGLVANTLPKRYSEPGLTPLRVLLKRGNIAQDLDLKSK